jgi:quercetin dioxygenase-like cupin family protein
VSLAERLRADGLAASPWSNGPGDTYAAHSHDYDKVLVCAEGSIVFGLPDRREHVVLEVGDRLDLPAGTRHDAVVGPVGVTCLEAHLPRGQFERPTRRPSGTW